MKSRSKLGKRVRTALDREVDQELISKRKDVLKGFDESQALYVPVKRRRAPKILGFSHGRKGIV